MCVNSLRELEEERRLLYVAITRAEKRCIMTCAQNRWRYGRVEFDTPSRFIRDIDPSLLYVEQSGIGSMGGSVFGSRRQSDNFDYNGNKYSRASSMVQNARPVATQFKADPKPRVVPPTPSNYPSSTTQPPSPTTQSPSALHEGSVVEHQRFGVGVVLKLEGTGENQKATVQFKNTGTKQLLLKFARIKVIE
jgi:DNA helicase-2/ATP-dependent DNA helicase PcrA